MSLKLKQIAFGEYVLDADEKVLFRHGKTVAVTPKIFDLLLALVENHGHIVQKSILMERVWAGSFVEDSNLTFSIRQLRKILGDDKHHPQFIETVPRRGYRFIANVEEIAPDENTKADRRSEPLISENLKSGGATSTISYLRPIIVGAVVLLTVGLLLSAAAIVWNPTRSEPRDLFAADPAARFETVASSNHPMSAAISPDGKYMAYTRTANGRNSLWLRQLSSEMNTQIIPPEDGTRYLGLEFSPNGEYVYVARANNNGPAHIDRISILGGPPKLNIITGIDGAFSISPDERSISYRRYGPQTRRLFIANIDGGGERQIFETDKTFTDNVFSPDGQSVAFAMGQSDTGERDFGVYVVDISNGEFKRATQFSWLHVRSIEWLPDQSGLIVTGRSDASDLSRLWSISFTDGRVEGVLQPQAGFVYVSAAKDFSKALLMKVSRNSNLYLALSSNLEDIRPVTIAFDGIGWMPDGGLVYSSPVTANRNLWRLDADRITQKQLTVEDSVDFEPVVSPDGRYIVFVSNRAGRFNIWRINADGGNPVQLTFGSGEQRPAFTADGSAVIFNSMNDVSLWKVPIEGGEPSRTSTEGAYAVSISPDGSKVAVIKAIDGETKVVIRLLAEDKPFATFAIPAGLVAGGNITWTSDGKSVCYAADSGTGVGNIWRQPLIGGQAEMITHYSSEEIFDFSASPDGSQMAFVRGSWEYEVILIERPPAVAISAISQKR